jgi:hypothetical protein
MTATRPPGTAARSRRQGGGQPGEQDVQAAFEFSRAVVGGQDGGQAAEQGELPDRQPVQVIRLVGVLDEFLQLVEDMAVQKPNRAR